MTLHLGDYLEWGELRHSASDTVHGFLQLRDMDVPLYIELTGRPSPDLIAKAWRFLPRGADPSIFEPEDPALVDEVIQAAAHEKDDDPTSSDCLTDSSATARDFFDIPPAPQSRLPFRIQPHQIGATGKMTAACYVPASDDELPTSDATALPPAAPPPTGERRVLFLEWFSQNGRVTLELVDPVIEISDARIKRNEESVWHPAPEPASRVQLDRESTLADYFRELEPGEPHPGADIPDDRDLSSAEFVAQLELMDDCYTSRGGDSLAPLIREFVPSTPLDDLSEEEIEISLRYALAQLALRGVAIHSCEHDTPRTLFEYIRTFIAEKGEHFPPLRNTPFTQHYLTSESCTHCIEEFEERYSSDSP